MAQKHARQGDESDESPSQDTVCECNGAGSLGEKAARDGVEHAIEEVDGFGSRVAAANFQRFVDDNGNGVPLRAKHLADGHTQKVAIDRGMRSRRQCLELATMSSSMLPGVRSRPKQIFGEAANLGLDRVVACLKMWRGPDRESACHVSLEKHLHRELPRLAPRSGAQLQPLLELVVEAHHFDGSEGRFEALVAALMPAR